MQYKIMPHYCSMHNGTSQNPKSAQVVQHTRIFNILHEGIKAGNKYILLLWESGDEVYVL